MKKKIVLIFLFFLFHSSVFAGMKPADDQLFNAVSSSNLVAVKEAIDSGADVNAKWKYSGAKPLFWAKKAEIVELLIANGADVHAQAGNGSTPLHQSPSFEVANVLLSNGADPNAQDKAGWTPLYWALNKELAQLLLDSGAEINHRDKLGSTPLFQQVYLGHVEVVKLLIEKGANVNAIDKEGWTALHIAVRGPYPQEKKVTIVKMLLDAGSQKDAATTHKRRNISELDAFFPKGTTPLDLAQNINLEEVIKLLK